MSTKSNRVNRTQGRLLELATGKWTNQIISPTMSLQTTTCCGASQKKMEKELKENWTGN